MRNLLGRLHARSLEELGRVATAWQVPLPSGDRLALVSRLYRALSDPRTARDCWARLPDDERAMVRLLAVSEETAQPLPELARHLGVAEDEARQIAVRLYHKAIVAREGDDEPLPVGTLPRLFLPRELTLLFRRVQDEIDTGDLSETPLRALLALLDDRELEESAETWGIKVVPGLRGRDDVTRQLLHQVGNPDRVATVVARRRRDAALIWRAVFAAPEGEAVPLDQAAQAAGLGGVATGDARQAQRLREALAELEQALLVWHTYHSDGSRWLFIPSEIRAPRPVARDDLPALTPALVPPQHPAPWRPPFALAWDLLTLLREWSRPDAPRVHTATDLPRSWRRRLNSGLWNRGSEVPPIGYLEFLSALAQSEGLIVGGAEIGQDPLTVMPLSQSVRTWRDRSFADQTARLQRAWLGSGTWIEGSAREDVDVWGAEWVPFRRKLLVALADLPDDTWYTAGDLAGWLAARDPEMLGATFTVATARRVEPATGDDTGRRRAAIAEVVTVTLETALRWFGLVTIGEGERRERLIALTAAGRALAGGRFADGEEATGSTDSPALAIRASGEIELQTPSPLRVWSLSAFAELGTLDRVSTYRLTEESIGRALRAGFETRQIVSFLTAQTGGVLPPTLDAQLQAWSHEFRRARLRRAIVVTPDDATQRDHLLTSVTALGLAAQPLGDDAVLVLLPPGTDESIEAKVLTHLREAGYSPQWDSRKL